ncbi:MAG: 4-alpha-glucanotransferase [bacterium]|nr:4-alpha-glucanotransferase [bacterium]
MQVKAVNNRNVSFERQLTKNEMTQYKSVLSKAKEKVGQTGKSVFIVHDVCLPQNPSHNTGVGNLSSKESGKFFDFIKNYLGINTVEVLPQGQYPHHSPYSGTSLSLGYQEINPQLLTTKEFGKMLSKSDVKEIVDANNIAKKEKIANLENVLRDDSTQDKVLKKAFERFKNIDETSDLKKKYNEYCVKNNDWLEPKGIFKVLEKKNKTSNFSKWASDLEKNLYNFDSEKELKLSTIKKLATENKDDLDFFNFKQFLADEHLKIARKNLNDKGMKFVGDCLVGFTYDEMWANPKAFSSDKYVGNPSWRIVALDLDGIKNESSDAAKLLKRKTQLFAQRYDSLRVDVGWSYINQKVTDKNNVVLKKSYSDSVLDFMEKSIKEVKGKNFDLKDILYEFEAGVDDFSMFEGNELRSEVKNRTKVLSSMYMKDGWGSNNAFLNRNFNPDTFVFGVGNHDAQPLRQIAKGVEDEVAKGVFENHKRDAIPELSRILNIDEKILETPQEFAKAKWAEPMMAKNNMMFYMDVFGKEERFDKQWKNLIETVDENYAHKISADYMKEWQSAIKEGYGFNPMDALKKVFKAKGLDKTDKSLYDEICKFNDILLAPEENIFKRIIKNKNKFKYIKPISIAVASCVAFAGIVKAIVGSSDTKKSQDK